MSDSLDVPKSERYHLKESKGWNRIPKEVAAKREVDLESAAGVPAGAKKYGRKERSNRLLSKLRESVSADDDLEGWKSEGAASSKRAKRSSGCGCCCVAGWVVRPVMLLASLLGMVGIVAVIFIVWMFIKVCRFRFPGSRVLTDEPGASGVRGAEWRVMCMLEAALCADLLYRAGVLHFVYWCTVAHCGAGL